LSSLSIALRIVTSSPRMSVHWTAPDLADARPRLGREQDRHPVHQDRGAQQLLHVVGLDGEDRRVLGFAPAQRGIAR
jgi:hypothetical protein